jgi:hypothetical protein
MLYMHNKKIYIHFKLRLISNLFKPTFNKIIFSKLTKIHIIFTPHFMFISLKFNNFLVKFMTFLVILATLLENKKLSQIE